MACALAGMPCFLRLFFRVLRFESKYLVLGIVVLKIWARARVRVSNIGHCCAQNTGGELV